MSWIIWLLVAAIFLLPVALRLWVGDEPDNAITHESGDDEERDPDGMLAAA